jgi:hypothetical protein
MKGFWAVPAVFRAGPDDTAVATASRADLMKR